MRWWFRKKPKPPAIPTYPPPGTQPCVIVRNEPKRDPGIEVEEVDMSATGIFKIFGRRPK